MTEAFTENLLLVGVTLGITLILTNKTIGLNFNTIPVRSNFDNKFYKVKDMKDSQVASNVLSRLNDHAHTIINSLSDSLLKRRLKYKYNSKILSETFTDGTTSFSLGKESIHMCIRSKEDGNIHTNDEILLYVFLHELAHVGSLSIGHTEEFHKNFNILIKQAETLNLLNKNDILNSNEEYCGITF